MPNPESMVVVVVAAGYAADSSLGLRIPCSICSIAAIAGNASRIYYCAISF
jgi:hypothetical protein